MKKDSNIDIQWDFERFEDLKKSLPHSPLNESNVLIFKALDFLSQALRQKHPNFAPIKDMLPENKFPFKKAVLRDFGGDLKKRWYIEYYIYNQKTAKLERVREYKNLNKHRTVKGRRYAAIQRIHEINYNLQYTDFCKNDIIDPQAVRKKEPIKSVPDLTPGSGGSLDLIIKQVINATTPETANKKTNIAYKGVAERFINWLIKNKFSLAPSDPIAQTTAQQYIDYLFSVEKLHPNTVINNHAMLRTIFNKLVKRGFVAQNPFIGVETPKKVITTKNSAFSESEQQKIKKYVINHRPEFWPIIQLTFYCFIRNTEMIKLRIENVDLKEGKIFIPGHVSKNKKGQSVVIPAALSETLINMELDKYPKDFYLIGKGGTPSDKAMSRDWIQKQHKQILEYLQIQGKTFYSWKHTGVVNAYKSGVDLKSIQLQCRHATIEQTDQYLKTLGFQENESFKLGVKRL